MNVFDFLAVWRLRWGHNTEVRGSFPFFKGKLYKTLVRFAQSDLWSRWLAKLLIFSFLMLFFVFLTKIEFQRNALITLVGLLLIFGVVFSAFHGAIANIAMLGICTVSIALYLSWRIASVFELSLGFSLYSLLFISIVETCFLCYLLVGWIAKVWPMAENIQTEQALVSLTVTDHVLLTEGLHEDDIGPSFCQTQRHALP